MHSSGQDCRQYGGVKSCTDRTNVLHINKTSKEIYGIHVYSNIYSFFITIQHMQL